VIGGAGIIASGAAHRLLSSCRAVGARSSEASPLPPPPGSRHRREPNRKQCAQQPQTQQREGIVRCLFSVNVKYSLRSRRSFLSHASLAELLHLYSSPVAITFADDELEKFHRDRAAAVPPS
jgi:hypothetical protein